MSRLRHAFRGIVPAIRVESTPNGGGSSEHPGESDFFMTVTSTTPLVKIVACVVYK